MTATPATQPTLTPARKRLIRQMITRIPNTILATQYLGGLPSFADVPLARIGVWICHLEQNPPPKPRQPRKHAKSCPEEITQATAAPAAPDAVASDPGTTGEWYSALAIAKGLDIGVERVYSWMHFGWLVRAPMFTAEDIRAFVRAHPMEIKPRYLSDESWLWLVSVLAGSRD